MGAGQYSSRCQWRRKTAGAVRDQYGQPVDTHTEAGYLWGAVDTLTASRRSAKDQEGQQHLTTVRLRNYPSVRPGDQLVIDGTTFTVETVAGGTNETVCELTSPTWTVGGGTQ